MIPYRFLRIRMQRKGCFTGLLGLEGGWSSFFKYVGMIKMSSTISFMFKKWFENSLYNCLNFKIIKKSWKEKCMKSIKQLNNVWVDRKGCEGAEEGHYNYLSKTLPAQTVMFLLLIWQDHKLLLLTALSEEVLVSKETRQLYYGRKHRFAVMLLLSA